MGVVNGVRRHAEPLGITIPRSWRAECSLNWAECSLNRAESSRGLLLEFALFFGRIEFDRLQLRHQFLLFRVFRLPPHVFSHPLQ